MDAEHMKFSFLSAGDNPLRPGARGGGAGQDPEAEPIVGFDGRTEHVARG